SPNAQFHIQQLSKKLLARDQQRSDLLRSNRFGVHLAGTIPSAAAGQAHTHPCGPSSPSSLIKPPSHAASPAERLQILLASARHAATVITARPQVQSASPESQVP